MFTSQGAPWRFKRPSLMGKRQIEECKDGWSQMSDSFRPIWGPTLGAEIPWELGSAQWAASLIPQLYVTVLGEDTC